MTPQEIEDTAPETSAEAAKQRVRLYLVFKGGRQITMHDDGAEMLNDIADHVRKYGFSGWRITGDFILNMAEVAAAAAVDSVVEGGAA